MGREVRDMGLYFARTAERIIVEVSNVAFYSPKPSGFRQTISLWSLSMSVRILPQDGVAHRNRRENLHLAYASGYDFLGKALPNLIILSHKYLDCLHREAIPARREICPSARLFQSRKDDRGYSRFERWNEPL